MPKAFFVARGRAADARPARGSATEGRKKERRITQCEKKEEIIHHSTHARFLVDSVLAPGSCSLQTSHPFFSLFASVLQQITLARKPSLSASAASLSLYALIFAPTRLHLLLLTLISFCHDSSPTHACGRTACNAVKSTGPLSDPYMTALSVRAQVAPPLNTSTSSATSSINRAPGVKSSSKFGEMPSRRPTIKAREADIVKRSTGGVMLQS